MTIFIHEIGNRLLGDSFKTTYVVSLLKWYIDHLFVIQLFSHGWMKLRLQWISKIIKIMGFKGKHVRVDVKKLRILRKASTLERGILVRLYFYK